VLDRLYVANPMNETMKRNRIACLCAFGSPYSLGMMASELLFEILVRGNLVFLLQFGYERVRVHTFFCVLANGFVRS